MDKLTILQTLNAMLLNEMPAYRQTAARFAPDASAQRQLLRSLMNLRPPLPLSEEYLTLQDELLTAEREEKGVIDAAALPVIAAPNLALWRGDITRLAADAIVNAANHALLGCFHPCHGCIDNAIHSAAGLQLREACRRIMAAQDGAESPGRAKITPAYNLPCRCVIHTVGPIVAGRLRAEDRRCLAGCYRACLALAEQNNVKSLAFCCISTGEFRFPPDAAAEIAVRTVRDYVRRSQTEMKVIFNVFKPSDEAIYRRILGAAPPPEAGA